MSEGRSGLLVFVPAWNEEENLPGVLEEIRAGLPEADVLVVDDGSTDRTAEVARAHGAHVVSFPRNLGLPSGIAAGYAYALEHDYALTGRVDADGQHPVEELARLVDLVRRDECDVAVGSRFLSGDGYEPYRYRPDRARTFGTALLRRAMRVRLGESFADATSGMYAVNAKALPLLAQPFASGAPEVEALLRLSKGGLRIREVPVTMRDRAGGESKLQGKKAFLLVVTVIAALLAWRRRR
ncbi:MAG TPA: glycosyltransferase family 2 protein [Gaiellaceae bacterium]|nr:glycosyltransferase family 2 protein [Gaiellaceae bacterium]